THRLARHRVRRGEERRGSAGLSLVALCRGLLRHCAEGHDSREGRDGDAHPDEAEENARAVDAQLRPGFIDGTDEVGEETHQKVTASLARASTRFTSTGASTPRSSR